MSATLVPIQAVIMQKLNDVDDHGGYRALDLMHELDSDFQESEVQRELAGLLSSGVIELTIGRKLKLKRHL